MSLAERLMASKSVRAITQILVDHQLLGKFPIRTHRRTAWNRPLVKACRPKPSFALRVPVDRNMFLGASFPVAIPIFGRRVLALKSCASWAIHCDSRWSLPRRRLWDHPIGGVPGEAGGQKTAARSFMRSQLHGIALRGQLEFVSQSVAIRL